VLRAPGIYAADRLPLERLRAGMPVMDDAYTSHIHADDLAAIAVRALEPDAAPGIYNAADDTEMKMGDWLDRVADFSGLPRLPRGMNVDSFITESRRLDNRRIKDVLGVSLKYPTVHEGLRHEQALGVD
jgi:nucleoside-diphosphate-sugar epimerase